MEMPLPSFYELELANLYQESDYYPEDHTYVCLCHISGIYIELKYYTELKYQRYYKGKKQKTN